MTDQAPETASTKPVETIEPPVADNPNPEINIDEAGAPAVDGGESDEPAPRKTAAQDRAERLAARAKANREDRGEGIPHTGDFNDPAQTYGQHGQSPEPQQQPAAQAPETGPSDSPTPAKRKLRVRQEDKEFTEEEILALAQKAAAADSYFEDGKRFYDEAKRTSDESRRSPGAPHQGQPRTPTEQQPDESDPDQPHQDDPLAAAFEELQFGADPKATAEKVRKALSPELRAASQEELDRQRMRDDFTETVSTFKRIRDENAALFEDPYAEAVMERMMLDELRADLRGINVPEDRIPANPKELQDWHRHYRTKGYRVRKSEKVFNDVIGKYRGYRGDTTTPAPGHQPPAARPNPSQNARQPVVALNRDERRAGIPTQPARSSAPPSLPASFAAPKKAREATLAEMREARKGRPFRRAG